MEQKYLLLFQKRNVIIKHYSVFRETHVEIMHTKEELRMAKKIEDYILVFQNQELFDGVDSCKKIVPWLKATFM